MKTTRTIRIALAAFLAAAIAVPSAFGAGEPKNEKPFTRPAGGVSTQPRSVSVVPGGGSPVISGEPKNEYPFTAPAVADAGLARALREASSPSLGLSESKAEPPFTAPVVVAGAGSFDWTDAGIGALAATGVCLLGAGAYLLVSGPRRPTRPAGSHA
jgi:hypothetical protein